MKSSLLLRIASVLTLIHAALHTVGGMFGEPKSAAQTAARVSARILRFDMFGATRSYWDFYFGFGLVTSITLLLLAILLWMLSLLVRTDPSKARPYLLVLIAAFLALAAVSWKYFFAPPVVMELVIAVCIGFAYAVAGKKQS